MCLACEFSEAVDLKYSVVYLYISQAVDITLMEMDKQTIAKEEHSEVEVLKEGLKEATSQCSDLEVERQQRAEELKNLREQHSAELKSKGEETEQLVSQDEDAVNEMKQTGSN